MEQPAAERTEEIDIDDIDTEDVSVVVVLADFCAVLEWLLNGLGVLLPQFGVQERSIPLAVFGSAGEFYQKDGAEGGEAPKKGALERLKGK